MNLPANGKTGLIVAGLVLSSLSFMTGWIAKREGASEVRGADHQSILALESWRKEHTETTTTPGMERLRKAECDDPEPAPALREIGLARIRVDDDVKLALSE